jgi:hypothetical protein
LVSGVLIAGAILILRNGRNTNLKGNR